MHTHEQPMASGPPGERVQQFCTVCGARVETEHHFCGACGTALPAVAGEAPGAGASAPLSALRAAQQLLHAGKTRDAIRTVEAICGEHPEWASARIVLGIAYLRAGRVLDAQDALEAAERLAPGTFAGEVAFAEYHARLGFFDRSVERLERALALPAPSVQAHDAALELRRYCREHTTSLFYRRLAWPRLPFGGRHHGRTAGGTTSADTGRN